MDGEPAAQTVEEALARVLKSSAFARADRLRRLLEHLVRRTLSNETDRLKETLLGMEVFDRGRDFDPRIDPIVRIDARRLRARLEQYYADEGSLDSVEIVLEPGGYVPAFRKRGGLDCPSEQSQAAPRSVAVLPFTSLTEKPDIQYFAEGLAEEIINALAQQPGLRVIGRYVAFQFHPAKQDLQKVARRLRVDVLVTGSVRQQDERLRVNVQVMQASSGSVLWSDQYDRSAREMLAAQESISTQIAEWFRKSSAGPTETKNETRFLPGSDSSAYQLFLEGRHFRHQAHPEAYFRSIQCLEKAVAQDPNFASAWADLSSTYSLVLLYRLRKTQDILPRAQFAAQRALELNQHLSEAHCSLGLIAALGYQLCEAAEHFNAALRINPQHDHARAGRAVFCFAAAGYLDRAEDELELVVSEHPPLAFLNLGMVLYFARRFEPAAKTLEAGLAMNPATGGAWMMLGLTRERLGMTQAALEAYRRWEQLFPVPFAGAWRTAVEQFLTGNRAIAQRSTEEFMKAHRSGSFSVPDLAMDLLLRLGDTDRALDWVEKSYEARAFRLIHAAVDPVFDPIRNTRRFTTLAQRVIGDTAALKRLAETGQEDGVTQTVSLPDLVSNNIRVN